jgi:DNA-nicking Smr family endonuclease
VKNKDDISKTDKLLWEEYTKDPKDVFDKEIGIKKKIYKTRFKIDLHGYNLIDANNKIKEVILNNHINNYSEILLITGKGIHSNTENNTYVSKDLSKLRFSIPDYINSSPDLLNKIQSISNAPTKEGGDGALIIKLKKL